MVSGKLLTTETSMIITPSSPALAGTGITMLWLGNGIYYIHKCICGAEEHACGIIVLVSLGLPNRLQYLVQTRNNGNSRL